MARLRASLEGKAGRTKTRGAAGNAKAGGRRPNTPPDRQADPGRAGRRRLGRPEPRRGTDSDPVVIQVIYLTDAITRHRPIGRSTGTGATARGSRAIFDLIDPSAYYTRPIALRNPIVFYEGHLPAFSVIAFLRRGLGRAAGRCAARERCSSAASIPTAETRRAAQRRSRRRGRRATRSSPSPPRATRPSSSARRRPVPTTTVRPCSGPRRSTRRSSTRRCTRRRCSTCGTACRTSRSGSPRGRSRVTTISDGSLRPGRTNDRATVRIPAGAATLGADRDGSRSGGTTSSTQHRVDVPAFDIDVHNVTNADFLEFVEAGGYRDRQLWSRRGLGVGAGRADRRIPRSGRAPERSQTARWFWRGMFEEIPLPPDVAGLRQPGGSVGLRALEGAPAADAKPEYPSRRVRDAGRDRAVIPVGRGAADRRHGNFDFAGLGSACRSARVRRARAPGACTTWSATAGSGRRRSSVRSRASSPMASYPEYSADFFDGQHYVMKGASPATARELAAPQLPQLVPAELSVRVREVQDREVD